MSTFPRLDAQQIDALLETWNQGDVFVGPIDFFVAKHRTEFDEEEVPTAETGLLSERQTWKGFAVISQGCDIVRTVNNRPNVCVGALVSMSSDKMALIEKCLQPRFAFVPQLAQQNLVVDLDTVMTLSKAALVRFTDQKVRGWNTDKAGVDFAEAIGRKWSRFAFPDDFSIGMKPVEDRIKAKHDKDSDEGHMLTALQEIRVMGEPTWDAETVSITFYLITWDHVEEGDWPGLQNTFDAIIKRNTLPRRFQETSIIVTRHDRLYVSDYLNSVPLDLDYLSQRDQK